MNEKRRIAAVIRLSGGYRLMFEDNTSLKLLDERAGSYIPCKGDIIEFVFYRNQLIRGLKVNGKLIFNDSLPQILETLRKLTQTVEKDVEAEARKNKARLQKQQFAALPPLLKHRIKMFEYILGAQWRTDYLELELNLSTLAAKLAKEPADFVKDFSALTEAEKAAFYAPVKDLDSFQILDAKYLAEALQRDNQLGITGHDATMLLKSEVMRKERIVVYNLGMLRMEAVRKYMFTCAAKKK